MAPSNCVAVPYFERLVEYRVTLDRSLHSNFNENVRAEIINLAPQWEHQASHYVLVFQLKRGWHLNHFYWPNEQRYTCTCDNNVHRYLTHVASGSGVPVFVDTYIVSVPNE